MMRRAALALAILCIAAMPTAAERLVISLSNARVGVTSSFTGEDLVLFGTIEPDQGKTLMPSGYDLVVTVSGPPESTRTRRPAAKVETLRKRCTTNEAPSRRKRL